MPVHEKLAQGLEEVDVIIAGGTFLAATLFCSLADILQVALLPAWSLDDLLLPTQTSPSF